MVSSLPAPVEVGPDAAEAGVCVRFGAGGKQVYRATARGPGAEPGPRLERGNHMPWQCMVLRAATVGKTVGRAFDGRVTSRPQRPFSGPGLACR